ncbi:leucine-rich repeat domain-containing protein [Anaeramoeba flamelloides]|uniref:Leucine-rich repeat domain-containing protein n=1 Tax=Anaeramoeba flamelloides TaxID=1746091 RepID=A0AAV7YQG0_9EUKA|nr:leucine-rich repeat domain-containing protein [Anaeramoeba flamelloides]
MGTSFGNLKELDLESNKINKTAGVLNSLIPLNTLNLGNNKLDTFPKITNLHNLLYLTLTGNAIRHIINDDIQNLHMLDTLDLTSNLLVEFPEPIYKLSKLQTLYLDNNPKIPELSSSIDDLKELRILYLSRSCLETVSNELAILANLEELYLDNNDLDNFLPKACLWDLIQLNSLNLEENGFTGPIPGDFINFPELSFLSLSHNNFHGEYVLNSLLPLKIKEFLTVTTTTLN